MNKLHKHGKISWKKKSYMSMENFRRQEKFHELGKVP